MIFKLFINLIGVEKVEYYPLQMQKIEKTTDTVKVAQKALEAQRLLGEEEQRHLFRQLFKEWLDKGALSIGFLKEVE